MEVKHNVKFLGVTVSDDVAAIIEQAAARDPEMSKSRVVREAIREYADRHGIEVPA